MRPLFLALVAASALISGCLFAPAPTYPVTVSTPPSFDRSWDAALGAAADAGVQVTLADRSTGRITGAKAGVPVTIQLQQQADGTLKVTFSAPGSQESNPTLNDRWLGAYNRRMGR
jgi:hypothetical protein